jgi:hypothetical protein
MPINLRDSFDGDSFDTSKWNVTAKSGATATIENGRAKLLQVSGWSGVAIQSPVFSPADVRKKFSVEFELQMSATNYQVGNAGILPYFGFVPEGVTRDSSYYWGASKGIVFQWNNANIAYVKKTGSTNATVGVYKNISYSLGIVNRKIKIEILDGNMTFSIDNVVLASLTLPADFESYLGQNIRFEFLQGNYNSNQALFLDNIVIKTDENKYLFQDGNDIKKYTGGTSFSARINGSSSNAIILPSNSVIPSSYAGDITFEAWVNPETINGYDSIFASGSGGDNLLFCLYEGSIGLYASNSSSPTTVRSTAKVPIGQWTHIAIARQGSNLYMYMNGVLIETLAFHSSNFNLSSAGRWLASDGGGEIFHGKLSDIRIWDNARSQSDIEGNMDKRLTGTESGLLGYWKLNEGEGTAIIDQTPRKANGIANAAVTWVDDTPIQGTAWMTVGSSPVTKEMFDSDGMTDLSLINNEAIQKLISDAPELLCWTDEQTIPLSDNITEPVTTETSNGQIKEFSINQEMYYNSIGSITKG